MNERVMSSQAQRCHSQDDAFLLSGTCWKLEYLKDENSLFDVCLWYHLWTLWFAPDQCHTALSQPQAVCRPYRRLWGWILPKDPKKAPALSYLLLGCIYRYLMEV